MGFLVGNPRPPLHAKLLRASRPAGSTQSLVGGHCHRHTRPRGLLPRSMDSPALSLFLRGEFSVLCPESRAAVARPADSGARRANLFGTQIPRIGNSLKLQPTFRHENPASIPADPETDARILPVRTVAVDLLAGPHHNEPGRQLGVFVDATP